MPSGPSVDIFHVIDRMVHTNDAAQGASCKVVCGEELNLCLWCHRAWCLGLCLRHGDTGRYRSLIGLDAMLLYPGKLLVDACR